MSSAAVRAGVAVFAVYAVITCGFDVSEGRDDEALARHVLRSWSLGMQAPLNGNWVAGTNGRYYSAHEAGNALALVPGVAAADYVAAAAAPLAPAVDRETLAGALLPLIAALYAALTSVAFAICIETLFGLSARQTVALTFALAFTTMLAPYSRMLFDGVLAGGLMAAALASATMAARCGSSMAAVAAGVLTGAAFATRQPLALVAAGVLGHVAFDAAPPQRLRLLVLVAAGALPAVVWQGWYNDVRSGAFYLPAIAHPQFAAVNGPGNMLDGLSGLLFSPGKSIFVYSPLLVLAPFGWNRLRHAVPGLAWGLLVGIAAYLLVHASIRNWAGEWGWGPRYIVPILVPLMLMATPAIRAALEGARWKRNGVIALGLVGSVVQIVGVATNWHYHYADLFDRGRFDRATLAWSLRDGQLVEMVEVLGRNVGRLAGLPIEPAVVAGASLPTVASGNIVNLWPATAAASGVPLLVVAIGVVTAVLLVALTVRWALHVPDTRVVIA